jgi:hypothetical protein
MVRGNDFGATRKRVLCLPRGAGEAMLRGANVRASAGWAVDLGLHGLSAPMRRPRRVEIKGTLQLWRFVVALCLGWHRKS